MQSFKKVLLLLFLFTISFSHAQDTKLTIDPSVKIGKLANGLTYYIKNNKKPEKKVELRLVVNAGSILEDDDQQGLAHMTEHMAFNGTTHFKKNDIISYLQSIGVGFGNDLNAYTSFDETVYMLPIPTDKPGNIEKGFQILEDWAHGVSFLDEDIDGERNIILEESRLGKGAEDRMFKKVYPSLFAGSKYANRLPIGIDSIIKTFKHDAIRKFYKDWYRPNLMAVVVVGDIDVAVAEAFIKKHFAGLQNPTNERPRINAEVPPYTANKSMVVTDKEGTMYSTMLIYSFYEHEEATTVAEYKESITKSLFSTIVNQRLRELTQKENPPFLGAFVGFGSYARGYEGFQAQVYTGEGNISNSVTALVEEIERVKRFGVTEAELERAKTDMLTRMERLNNEKNKTESANYVGEYIRNFLTNEPIPGIEAEYNYYKELLPTITLLDVNGIGKDLTDNANFVVATTGPDATESVVIPTEAELLSIVTNASSNQDIKPYEEKAVATKLLTNEPKAGKIVSSTKNTKLGTTTYTLSNGLKVTVKKTDFKNDQILMSAKRFGGSNNYGLADKYNTSFLTSVITSMGIGEFSPTDLRKALTGKTASVSPMFSPTMDGFSGSSTVKDFETMLQLLHLYVHEPRKDTALFKSFIQKEKSQTTFMKANPQVAFIDTFYSTMYNNNPLTPVVIPKGEYYDKVNLDRVLDIYKERFGDASGLNFVLVGSLPDDVTEMLIEKYIASLPVSGKKYTYKDNGLRTAKGKINMLFQKGKEEKSLILAVYSGETKYSEDLAMKAEAISEVLNIKIIEELREKIQGIYGGGIYSSVEKYPYNNYNYVAQLPCGPEKVDTLIIALNNEINNIKTKGPSVENLNKVKQQWLEHYKTSIKENGTWVRNIQSIMIEDASIDYFLNYEKIVNALTTEQIKATAKLLFDGKNVITAILNPEEKTAE
ncbi:MAG: insulinase family protein [Chitinophagaceae bacterium]|nr:insulinase family protein [Chitinophagaceae bacterium]MCW5905764.1 insulinase family protein [Chitinophagaceae bacterium]